MRPTGKSRDVVVTEWDWANEHIYLHDTIATDKRTPTLNANGLIYGAPEASSDLVPWLDPIDNKAGFIKSEYRDANTPTTRTQAMLAPSPYWGDEPIWDSHTNIHNPMFDEKGRVWLTARIRPANAQPDYCKAGSNHPSAMAYPKPNANRQVEFYDPKTQKIEMIDLCFNTHHLQFDKDNVLWFSAGGNYDVIGWLDTKKWEATKDDAASQGWSPFVLDTNGNGKRDAGWTEPDAPSGSDEGQADHRRPLRRRPEPGRRLDLGLGHGLPGRRRALRSQDAADRVLSIPVQELESAGERLQPARLGHLERRRAVVPCSRAVTWRASIADSARAS